MDENPHASDVVEGGLGLRGLGLAVVITTGSLAATYRRYLKRDLHV